MTIVVGQVLDRIPFPRNYQLSFILFAVTGAAISYFFSSRFDVPDNEPSRAMASDEPWRERLRGLASLVLAERPFRRFVAKRLVYIMGSHLVMPLFALWYVRELQATDAQISIITTVQKATLLVGYYAWTRLRERRGARFVLLTTTLVMSLYPVVTAATREVWLMIVIAGLSSVFQAGINLVFFDELMKTVPEEHSALFVSVVQTLQNVQAIVGPLISTWLAGFIGLGGALIMGGGFRFLGFSLFLLDRGRGRPPTKDKDPARVS
jgi:predicted MFS family arabinose efflux permease